MVPIVGAFFIDLINLAVLTFYSWPGLIIGRQAKLRHNLENHASRIMMNLIRRQERAGDHSDARLTFN